MARKRNQAAKVLRRWMAIDAALAAAKGLHVPTFADTHGVSTTTILRDLKAFCAVGQYVAWKRRKGGWEYRWRYRSGVARMFVRNLSELEREAVSAALDAERRAREAPLFEE
jgi:hypothetical protein